ncbi:MAG: O-antigen ligase family protein [Elusimicrobia bacterium]|nr:O-antigen ligase family protein [Elusimicrobiota bacterium]
MRTKNIVAILFLAILLFTPLLFLVNKTKNPFLLQGIFLNCGMAFIMILSLARFCFKGVVFPRSPFDRFWISWLGIVALSLLFTLLQNQGGRKAILVMGLDNVIFLLLNCIAVFYLAFVLSQLKDFLKAVSYVLLTVAVFACGYGLLQYFGFELLWSQQVGYFQGRLVSTFGNPAFLASFLVMLIPLTAGCWLNAQTKTGKIIFLSLLLLLGTTLLATSARSALLGLAVAFSLFILYLFKLGYRREIKVLSLSLLALVLLGGALILFSGQKELLRARLEGLVNPPALGTSLQQRFLIWCCSLEMFYKHPFTGQGWGLFELFYPYYQSSYLQNPAFATYKTHANHAHNEILHIAAELGVAGILFSLYFFSVLTKQFKILLKSQITREQQIMALGLFSGIIGMIVDSLFNVAFHIVAPAMVFWCLIGLLSGLNPVSSPVKPAASSLWRLAAALLMPLLLLIVGLNVLRLQAAIHHFTGINYFAVSEKAPATEKQQKYSLLIRGGQELQQSLRQFPWNTEAAYDLGGIYFRLGEIGKAGETYSYAAELNFGYDEIFYMLGVSLLDQGCPEKAVKFFQQAMTLNPNSETIKSALTEVSKQAPK